MLKVKPTLIFCAILFLLSGCSVHSNQTTNQTVIQKQKNMDTISIATSEVPKGLKEAKNPKFKVGSRVIIQANHMPGMYGAKATIVGAYDTTVYSVSYTPTTGGPTVKNHKWVIHEEIKNAGNEPFKPGAQVILEANHMPGMKGATATIDSAQQTTAYMVDYTPTNGGEPVKNHKWLIGSELSAP